jgi:hypothetical protein
MPQIGSDLLPSHGYHAYEGTSYPNQEAEDVTCPAQRVRILRLGAWIGGWNDAPKVRLTVWHPTTGDILGQSAEFTVANRGAADKGKVNRYEADLEVPYVTAGPSAVLRVGFSKVRNDAHQVTTGTIGAGHIHGRASYPAGPFDEYGGGWSENRRIGCWVQHYVALANAYVLRSGVWQRATPKVQRSGALVDASGVKVWRSGAWVDAN